MNRHLDVHYQRAQRLQTLAENTRSLMNILGDLLTIGEFKCNYNGPASRQNWSHGCLIEEVRGTYHVVFYCMSKSGKSRTGEKTLFSVTPRNTNCTTQAILDQGVLKFTVTFGSKTSDVSEQGLREAIPYLLGFDDKKNLLKAA